MFDLIKKSMLAGIGLALKTKDEVEEFAKELIKKEKMSEKEGKKFFDDLLNRYEETRTKLEEKLEKTIKDVLKKANVVTADELKELKNEIKELKETISNKSDTAQ
ncbi:MAG: hypothetical protein JW786_14445 [Desulfobacterales bacterium]|nr:hypothetical protein [Desulfobacterales bacterium]